MKKMLKLLSAMAVLVCGLMMTGCMLNDDEKEVLGPNNVWCEFRSKNNDDSDVSKKGKYYFKYVDATKTFSVAFLPDEGSSLKTILDGVVPNGKIGCYIKEYDVTTGKAKDFDENDEDKSLGFQMSQIKWIVLCRALKRSDLPSNAHPVTKATLGDSFTQLKASFDLRNVLDNFVDKVLNSIFTDEDF